MNLIKKFALLAVVILFSQKLFSQKEYRLNSVKFEGNKILSNDQLQKQINTPSKKTYEKLYIWKRNPEFTSFVLENDINRLKTYYNRNGFLNTQISYSLDTLKHRRLNVSIKIEENDYIRINNVNVNFNSDTLNDEIKNAIRTKILLKTNDRFIDENVFKTELLIHETFANKGFPFSTIDYKIKLLPDKQHSDISFDIHSGNRCFFGEISVYGDSIVPRKFINKYIRFSRRELYNQTIIDKTQQDLFETELFQYVVIRPLKDSVKQNQIPIDVLIKELPRWAFETGIGYGTDDRFRLSVILTRLNLFGGTRKLILKAKTSYYTPYNFELKFIQPNIFIQDLNLVVNPFYVQEREESYEIERIGGGVTFQYQISKKLNTGLTYSLEKDNLLEISDLQLNENELKHNKSSITWGTQFVSTKNIFNPKQGSKINSNISYSGLGFNSQFHYYKIDFTFRKYFSLNQLVTLATKIKAGVMQTLMHDPETPIEDRYFAGGASSLRGWGRNDIYPFNMDGFAIGGNSLLEGSIEMRYPIYDILGGALFLDFGNVWAGSYQYELNSLNYNMGLGLRVKTPIGPVRVDMATPIINDNFAFQFFISVGHAF